MSLIPGSKPKPTQFHILNGNPSKIDLTKRVDYNMENGQFANGEVPEPPEWIKNNKTAKTEWERIAPLLARMKILTPADMVALEAYCKCWSRYREAEEQMDRVNSTFFKTPSGYIQQLPQVAIAQKYLKLCKEFMCEFGLTPSSRGRILSPGEKEDEDDMEKLLKECRY